MIAKVDSLGRRRRSDMNAKHNEQGPNQMGLSRLRSALARTWVFTGCLALAGGVAAADPPEVDVYGFDDSIQAESVDYPAWFNEPFLDLPRDLKQAVAAGKQGLMVYFGQKRCAYCHKLMKVNLAMEDIVEYTRKHFDVVPIDIWGVDHHGYIPRMMAGVQALGRHREDLRVILVQLVSLLRDGKPVAMSTRAGEFVTLRQVVDEVGKDAARYNFLMRRSDSHLDFDLELAKRQSNENPVYYVQYAHARVCSVLRQAADKGIALEPSPGTMHLELLTEARQAVAELESLEAYFSGMDVIFAEGYKNARKPKIEIFRSNIHDAPLSINDKMLVALVTDADIQCRVPKFGLDEIDKLADLIERVFLKNKKTNA